VVILVVLDYVGRSYLGLWERASSLGIDLHMAGTLEPPRHPAIPFEPRPPMLGTFHDLRPRRLRGERVGWWRYPGLPRIIESVDPDVVHVKSEPWSLLTSQVLACGRATVVHGAETLYDKGSMLERTLRRAPAARNLRRLAGFVGWSPAAVAATRCWGLPAATPVSVVPAEPPDPAAFEKAAGQRREARAALGFGDELVIGFVGRYSPEKGVDWLLAAFERAALPDARLACFGTGPERAHLHQIALRLDGRVYDYGPLALEAVPRTMAALDVVVVPSLSVATLAEQFGKVAVEAMLSRIPVVASRSGVLPEVVGDAGLTVDEDDADGLAAILRDLAARPQLRDELAERGWRRANCAFAPAPLAERLVAFWGRVVREQGG
jgi:glycosyltransferase involved in cell wall biosynthesis